MKKAFEDSFNLLCGDKLGSGIHRDVFQCRLRPDLVVKVEIEEAWRLFPNVKEQRFWDENQRYKKVADWLAPCEYLSPDGRVLLQKKCDPLPTSYKLPGKLPTFLTDIKRDNFALLDGRLVCVDYASVNINPELRPRKAYWEE